MQLTEEYFGKSFVSLEEWESNPSKHKDYCKINAELLIQIAEYFNYCIIFFSLNPQPPEEYLVDSIKILKEMDDNHHLIMTHGDSTMSIPTGENMVGLSIKLFEKADEIKAGQEKNLKDMLNRGRQLMDAGLDGFILCADYCFNSGPFLSPEMFSEFVAPYLTMLIKGYQDMNAYVIKHTDGNIMPILAQIVQANPHGLHSLDPMAGVDIKEIKKLCGSRICLIGNVNCALMQTGTEEEILESCKYAMENGKPGGGYIFSTSNVIFKGMPKKSYDLMIDYYRKNNRY